MTPLVLLNALSLPPPPSLLTQCLQAAAASGHGDNLDERLPAAQVCADRPAWLAGDDE